MLAASANFPLPVSDDRFDSFIVDHTQSLSPMPFGCMLLAGAHTSISTPCEIGVLMILTLSMIPQVITKAAPGLSHLVSRSASSHFRS